jgi:hypothetical protein
MVTAPSQTEFVYVGIANTFIPSVQQHEVEIKRPCRRLEFGDWNTNRRYCSVLARNYRIAFTALR